MKSHQYASKRRLTNICCILVCLAFAKFIFAAYLSTGIQFFTSESDKNAKMQQMAIEQRNRIEASQRAALLATGQMLPESVEQTVSAPAPLNQESGLNQNTFTANVEDANHVASNSRVSFLPKSKNATDALDATPQITSAAYDAITPQIATASHAQANPQFAQVPNPELSEEVNGDMVLAQASSSTANIARAQMRANLMQNVMGKDFQNTNLDSLPTNPNYHAPRNSVPNHNAPRQNVPNHNTPNYNTPNYNVPSHNAPSYMASATNNLTASANTGNSFFNFIGTANATEAENSDDPTKYVRPDEDFNNPMPTPNVTNYTSPDTLEYKRSELTRKEEELLALQIQMNARLKELNDLESKVGGMVQDASALQGDKFKHLIETYTNMKPRMAAEALVTLDESIAVRILNGMKSKQSGEIFSYMDPVQSARLSAAMSQFKL